MATVTGTKFNDVMTPTIGQYVQNGVVITRAANKTTSLADLVNGGDGNNSIDGGGGNDTMIAGLGNDTARGGSRSRSDRRPRWQRQAVR